MIAYRVKFDYCQATITEFSYEGTTPAFYTGCKLVREVRGFGYVPRNGKIPKLDTCPTLEAAVISMSSAAREVMKQKQREVNRINTEIGQLESLLRKTA